MPHRFILVLALAALPALDLAAGPVLNFSDFTVGPRTGNTDTSLGQVSGQDGAIVTVWGTGLGSAQGSSQIFLGGVPAANVYYWGNAVAPYSPADMYSAQGMQEVVFQVSHLAADGLGSISVNVGGATSNTLPFTVSAGTIRFVSTAGNDSTATGTWTSPYRTMQKAVAAMTPGSITYVENGVHATSMAEGDPGWSTTLGLRNSHGSGTAAAPYGLAAYPGAMVYVGTSSVPRGIECYNNPYWTVSKLNVTGQQTAITFVWSGYRVIGNHVDTATATTGYDTVDVSGNNVTVFGNEFTQCGGPGISKLYHPLYVSSARATSGARLPSESNRDIGWNYFHDNPANRAINIYSESASTAFMLNTKVHDNYIINQTGGGMLLGQYMCGDNYVYNNVIINAGLGPDPNGDAQQHVGVEIEPGVVAADAPATTLYFFNNTIYGCGWGGAASPSYTGNVRIYSGNYTLRFKNNIIVSTGQPYLTSDSTAPAAGSSSNNLWYGKGAAPAWDTGALNAAPKFVGPLQRDFRLQPRSPAVDAGLDLSALLNRDFLNVPRPQGAGFDLGAYELVPPLLGDANLDGRVDVNDLAAVAANYDRGGMDWVHGDFGGDAMVDVTDLGAVAAHYGQAAGGFLPVPEPVVLTLLVAGGAFLTHRRRRPTG